MGEEVYQQALQLHKDNRGKIAISPVVKVENRSDLSLVYTPGVAQVSREVAKNKNLSFELTWRGRAVAVVSDGSAVLGLGNIGAEAAMPVMEGKALIFKQFGGVEAVPLCVDLHTADELVNFVKAIAPSFGGINLEDIAAPLCIEVEDRLQEIGIPVVHDDQHGTAMVVSAAIMNSAKVVGKQYGDLKVVISGAGSAGLAIAQMLLSLDRVGGELSEVEGKRVGEVIILDSKGVIAEKSGDWKGKFAKVTNQSGVRGGLSEAVKGADVFVGVSKGGILSRAMVESMAKKAIVLAMANPDPEILPDEAKAGGAMIVGTGRSDFNNQVNNSLIFPGLFKGLLRAGATKISVAIKQAARDALAESVVPTAEMILPSMFNEGIADKIAAAVEAQVNQEHLARVDS
jgi:malate dehydrogenase (oxaloacetate-decarboxylating)